jgi:IclR family acetate operon transcriptional repressor
VTTAPTATADQATLHKSRSAERALTLLDTVITRGSIGLSDAATEVGIPTSTALRHLRALMESGYLLRDDLGRYSVGPTFLRLALAAFRSGPYARLIAAAQPHLDHLAATTEESVYVAVRDGRDAVYIATVESPRAIRHVGWVGRSVPLDGTAIGASLRAAPPAPDQRPVLNVNTGAIESDVTALTAPIHDRDGVIGALSILGPADRLADERLELAGDALIDAAMSITRAMTAPAEATK